MMVRMLMHACGIFLVVASVSLLAYTCFPGLANVYVLFPLKFLYLMVALILPTKLAVALLLLVMFLLVLAMTQVVSSDERTRTQSWLCACYTVAGVILLAFSMWWNAHGQSTW